MSLSGQSVWSGVAAVLCLSFGVGAVHAAPELATLAEVRWGSNILALENGMTDMGVGMASTSDGYASNPSFPGTFSGTASANAAFGSFGVSSSFTADDVTTLIHQAAGSAGYTEDITITGDTGTGEITFTFNITGSSTTTGKGSVVVLLASVQDPDGVGLTDLKDDFTQGGFMHTTMPFPFTFGTQFEMDFVLNVTASMFNDTIFDPVDGTASAMFGNTVELVDFTVKNSSGQVVANPTVVTGSGNPLAVPEPASLAVLLAGMLGASMRRHRRRTA